MKNALAQLSAISNKKGEKTMSYFKDNYSDDYSLCATNDTTECIIEQLIDEDFMKDFISHKNTNQINEEDVIVYFLSKETLTFNQSILLDRFCYEMSYCPEDEYAVEEMKREAEQKGMMHYE